MEKKKQLSCVAVAVRHCSVPLEPLQVPKTNPRTHTYKAKEDRKIHSLSSLIPLPFNVLSSLFSGSSSHVSLSKWTFPLRIHPYFSFSFFFSGLIICKPSTMVSKDATPQFFIVSILFYSSGLKPCEIHSLGSLFSVSSGLIHLTPCCSM